jgi:protein-ribulosamine 3-kinase
VSCGDTGRDMCRGEFESLKAIYMVSPEFVPEPYAWGMFEWQGPDTYFLLTAFRDVDTQVC